MEFVPARGADNGSAEVSGRRGRRAGRASGRSQACAGPPTRIQSRMTEEEGRRSPHTRGLHMGEQEMRRLSAWGTTPVQSGREDEGVGEAYR